MTDKTQLGELESEVMGIVWDRGEVSVHDVKGILEPSRPLAYTTVMTVLTRLAEKGLLSRRKEGRAYLYAPVEAQDKVAGSLLRSLVKRLYDGATAPAIAHLLQAEDSLDDGELEKLERLIHEKRQDNRP